MKQRDLVELARVALKADQENRPFYVTPEEYLTVSRLLTDNPDEWDKAIIGVIHSDYGWFWLPHPGRSVSVVVTDIEAMIEPPEPPSFVCPRCGARSFNPNDVKEGYCGKCHDYTRGGVSARAHPGDVFDMPPPIEPPPSS
jgi:hypothetical protein